MLDIERPGAVTRNNQRLQVATGTVRAALELRSWLPEHKNGEQSIKLDGRELPREVGAILYGPARVLCLGPGEWFVVSDEQTASNIAGGAADVTTQGAVLVDTTDGIGVLSVSGPLAREVLSKSCGLDLRPHAFPVGRCARTRLAQVQVIVDHTDDAPRFRLYVARSYLQFLADWIEDAAVEFNHSPL